MKIKPLIDELKAASVRTHPAEPVTLPHQTIDNLIYGLEAGEKMREALGLVEGLQKLGEIWSVDPAAFRTFKAKVAEALKGGEG